MCTEPRDPASNSNDRVMGASKVKSSPLLSRFTAPKLNAMVCAARRLCVKEKRTEMPASEHSDAL